MLNLGEMYHKYLIKLDNEREKDENLFHASSSGSCYRKLLYRYFDYPKGKKSMKSYMVLDLGTVVHKRFEESIKWCIENDKKDADIYVEDDISIPSLSVVGRYDVGAHDSNGDFWLYDIKTAAAYKWTTKFGLKKNRKPLSDTNYKLQLGTYAMGIRRKYKPESMTMFLFWYNKNTSQVREQIVAPEWESKAYEYWADVNNILAKYGKNFENSDILMPGISQGTPFQDWECAYGTGKSRVYCDYYDVCPSKIGDKR